MKLLIGTNMFHFILINNLQSTITYVIIDSHALKWNKLLYWNNVEEHIQFQL